MQTAARERVVQSTFPSCEALLQTTREPPFPSAESNFPFCPSCSKLSTMTCPFSAHLRLRLALVPASALHTPCLCSSVSSQELKRGKESPTTAETQSITFHDFTSATAVRIWLFPTPWVKQALLGCATNDSVNTQDNSEREYNHLLTAFYTRNSSSACASSGPLTCRSCVRSDLFPTRTTGVSSVRRTR